MPAASDGDRARDLAARRRAVVRRHHPDAGGSAEELVAALAALDQRPTIRVAPSFHGRLRRLLRHTVRRGRAPRNLQ